MRLVRISTIFRTFWRHGVHDLARLAGSPPPLGLRALTPRVSSRKCGPQSAQGKGLLPHRCRQDNFYKELTGTMYRRPAKAAHHQPDRFSVSRWGALRYNGVKESNMALPSSCAIPRFWGESLAFAALVFLFKTCWITLKQVTPLTSSWSRSRLLPVKWPSRPWRPQRTRSSRGSGEDSAGRMPPEGPLEPSDWA